MTRRDPSTGGDEAVHPPLTARVLRNFAVLFAILFGVFLMLSLLGLAWVGSSYEGPGRDPRLADLQFAVKAESITIRDEISDYIEREGKIPPDGFISRERLERSSGRFRISTSQYAVDLRIGVDGMTAEWTATIWDPRGRWSFRP